jgi:hypothetical protein
MSIPGFGLCALSLAHIADKSILHIIKSSFIALKIQKKTQM